MATKRTTKKAEKKEEPVITPEEVVTEEVITEEAVTTPVKAELPDYSNLSPFGRMMAGGGVN